MSEQPPSWADLNQTEFVPADNRFVEVCALVFSAGPGKELLAELRKRHFDSQFSPLAPERALALRIAQQHFVRELEIACERGLKEIAKRKPKP